MRCKYVFVQPNGAQLRRLAGLVDAGTLRPPEIEEMKLEQAAEALERSRQGHVRGKIVLKVR